MNQQSGYALKFPNGSYYTGRVNTDSEPNAWQGTKRQAWTYGIYMADHHLTMTPYFRNCTVEYVEC